MRKEKFLKKLVRRARKFVDIVAEVTIALWLFGSLIILSIFGFALLMALVHP